MNANSVAANNGFVDIVSSVNNLPVVDTYAFDANSNMKVGWIETVENNWYYADTDVKNYGKIVNFL